MTPASSVVLHGGAGLEIGLLEYVFRVGVHLLAFVAVAVVVSRGPGIVSAVRSWLVARSNGGENDA